MVTGFRPEPINNDPEEDPTQPIIEGPIDTGSGGDDTTDDEELEPIKFNPTTDDVMDMIGGVIENQLVLWGQVNGYSPLEMSNLFDVNWQDQKAITYVDLFLARAEKQHQDWMEKVVANGLNPEWGTPIQQQGLEYYTRNPDGTRELISDVWRWFGTHTNLNLGDFSGSIGGGGGSRGGGGSGISRDSFDINELTEAAQNIWRGLLLTDDFDARGMAKSYVDAVLASGGKKKIDFREFVRGKAQKTARYASIYRSKPESLSEEQYLAPYHQSALQALRPEQADEVAIGGAQFGASADAFAARLRRERTDQAPFMQSLEGRLRNLNSVFRG